MHGAKFIDMRQHGTNAGSFGLKPIIAQQGIEPDQFAAGAVQTIHFKGELLNSVSLQAIGKQEKGRALPQNAA